MKKKCKVGGVYQAGVGLTGIYGKPLRNKCKEGGVYQAEAGLTGTMGNH